ncbi:MAG: hypothetical protein U5L07_03655 [Desulfobacterales bacterium]|nr:hypothetical protein [Desulfobacterales bacterium]
MADILKTSDKGFWSRPADHIQKADMAMYDAKRRPDQVFAYADAARISPETAQ